MCLVPDSVRSPAVSDHRILYSKMHRQKQYSHNFAYNIQGPVDKCQKTAETRSGPGRIGNMQIEKDGACHPFKV